MELPINRQLSAEEEESLKESLKRCPAGTFEAVKAFRETGELERIPEIVEGIAERFLEPEMRPLLKKGDDSLRIFEDLGIDSLTMVEVILLIEETLSIKIENEELRDLRTIGDVTSFIDSKVKGLPAPDVARTTGTAELHEIMPHQPPFLFLQEAAIGEEGATGIYKITGSEYFLEGHFKDRPVFPASIMLEALGQLGVFFLLRGDHEAINRVVNPETIYFTSCNGVRVQRICKPGDVLKLRVKPKRVRHPLATFEGQIITNSEKVAFAEEITLAFDYQA